MESDWNAVYEYFSFYEFSYALSQNINTILQK